MKTKNPKGVLKWFNNNAKKFNYDDAIYMSRATGLIMWLTSDYFPYQLACRDKYEYRDTVLRGSSIGLVFWGGDLLLKKLFSKASDKFMATLGFGLPYALNRILRKSVKQDMGNVNKNNTYNPVKKSDLFSAFKV